MMVDVTLIDVNYLGILAGMYMGAALNFKCEPEKASPRIQRKIYKWISKFYKRKIQDFPKKLSKYFEKESNIYELMLLLKACSEEIKLNGTEKERKFNKATVGVGEDVKSALWTLIRQVCWQPVKCEGKDAKIVIEDNSAFCRTVLLKDVVGVPENMDSYYIDDAELVLKQDQNRFSLYGEIEDFGGEIRRPFSIRFSSAEVDVQVYNCIENTSVDENPWEYIRGMAFDIATKASLPGEYCNSAEKEMLPLINEIVHLEYCLGDPFSEYTSFEELKRLTQKYGHNKITELLMKAEMNKIGSDKYNRLVSRIIRKLCEKKCESLWRDIFEKLEKSQEEYPNKVEKRCSVELIDKMRMDIEMLMEDNGYLGTYPDFVKKGSIKGIKLEASYGMTYFIALEKRVEYRIHCFETLEEKGYLEVKFLCGTAMLKKNEQIEDIYSCLFNAKGKRLFHLMHHYISLNEDGNGDYLKTSVDVAVKKAECKKLTKEEKKEYYGQTIPGICMFMFYLIVAGGMFSIFFNIGMILIAVIIFAVTGEYSQIPSIFTDFPWGWLLLFAAVGFGAPMGIIEVLAKRK